VELAKAQIAQRLKERLERKAELERLLAVRGFKIEPGFLTVRNLNNVSLEIDVRRKTVVEFTGRDPPPPVGVDVNGQLFAMDGGGRCGSKVTREDALTLGGRSLDGAISDTVWRARTLKKHCAVLRWPPRLYKNEKVALERLLEDLNAPLCLPVELEMRAARRATLLAALRSQPFLETRIPLSVADVHEQGPVYAFLRTKQWPRPRALSAALVGDVALSMQRDIFAALPQLAISIICDFLDGDDDCGDEEDDLKIKGFDSLIKVSFAFALGAAIWNLNYT
jgi:hypothetical protein